MWPRGLKSFNICFFSVLSCAGSFSLFFFFLIDLGQDEPRRKRKEWQESPGKKAQKCNQGQERKKEKKDDSLEV